MKKLIGIVALLALFASPALAQTNPWGTQAVPIQVTVQEMVEMWTGLANVNLTIGNAGGNGGETNAVSGTVTHLSNVAVNVSVQLTAGDIPNNTQFHILIKPTAGWSMLSTATAEKVISWRRDGADYVNGATEVPPSNVNVYPKDLTVVAFSASASSSMVNVPIQYFAQAPNGLPQTPGMTPFTVTWTISEQ